MGSDIIPDSELNCVDLYCPIPIAQTKEEIDKLEVGQVLIKWRLMILRQRRT